jgi:hypothetical protein
MAAQAFRHGFLPIGKDASDPDSNKAAQLWADCFAPLRTGH